MSRKSVRLHPEAAAAEAGADTSSAKSMRLVKSRNASEDPPGPPARPSKKKGASSGEQDWNEVEEISELILRMNDQIDSTPIHQMTAEEASGIRRRMWNSFTPWNNIDLLRLGFDLWVLPERPVYVSGRRPIFVINVAPAGSGKSRILQILSDLKIFPGFDPIVVDPDELNEFFVEVFGYHPPKTEFVPTCRSGLAAAGPGPGAAADPGPGAAADPGPGAAADPGPGAAADPCCVSVGAGQIGWWSENRHHFRVYEHVFNPLPNGDGINKANRIRPIAPSCCTSKTYNITTKYGEILGNHEVIEHIFQKAINPDGVNHSDIVFDSTGGAMQDVIDTYIDHANRLGYEIVIAGMFSTPENCSIRAEDRNGKQHRRMTRSLVWRLANEFRLNQTIFKWEQYSREHKCRFVLAENNWLPGIGGQAKLVFHRTPDGNVININSESVLFTPTGFYGMRFDKDRTIFVGQEAVAAEKAEAERAAAAEKKGRSGGTSRKRRVSRRRLHGSRVRKTVKKYYRHRTRRSHYHRHSHRRH